MLHVLSSSHVPQIGNSIVGRIAITMVNMQASHIERSVQKCGGNKTMHGVVQLVNLDVMISRRML